MITKKYYKLVKVSYEDSGYFYIKNVSDQAGTLTIGSGGTLRKNLEYSTDGVNWTTAATNAKFSLTVPAGTSVYMRGTNSMWAFGLSYVTETNPIKMDVDHIVGGNVYSLLDKSTFASRTTAVGHDELYSLFDGNTHLVSAADMNFGNVTTLQNNSYFRMFSGCTSLTIAPELPATTLAVDCYGSMFSGCVLLTTAPALPVTTIRSGCYSYMFYNCTSLTTAPALPATTLANQCYASMFEGCTSLNSVKCLAEDISASMCTSNWLSGVSATGTFYKSANMSSWTTGASGIPSGWTVVDA